MRPSMPLSRHSDRQGPCGDLWSEGYRPDPRIAFGTPVLAMLGPDDVAPIHLAAVAGWGGWIEPLDLPN